MLKHASVTFSFFILVPFIGCRNDARHEAPPDSSAERAPSKTVPSELGLGETATLPTCRVRFVSQRRCSPTEPGMPQNGSFLWAAEIELANLSEHPVPVNPFHFTLTDAQNHSYVTSLIGCPPLLEAKFLLPGERTRGHVPFELPQSIQMATLTYRTVSEENEKETSQTQNAETSNLSARFHVTF